MKFKNISSVGALDIPVLGRIAEAGETFVVPDELAEAFAAQTDNYLAVDKAAKSARDEANDNLAAVVADVADPVTDAAPVDDAPVIETPPVGNGQDVDPDSPDDDGPQDTDVTPDAVSDDDTEVTA